VPHAISLAVGAARCLNIAAMPRLVWLTANTPIACDAYFRHTMWRDFPLSLAAQIDNSLKPIMHGLAV
jgi:hypothetical protein